MENRVICVLTGGPTMMIKIKGAKWYFEDHHYCGPSPVYKNTGDVREVSVYSPFWKAISQWYQQGKKLDGNEAIYDPSIPLRSLKA